MLTNPTTSSTSGLSSSSLVEATSLPSPASTAIGTALTPLASGQEIAESSRQNSVEPQTPSKRKKKATKANSTTNPLAEVGSSSKTVPSVGNNLSSSSNDNGKKRSRKQKIDVRGGEGFELNLALPEKSTKRRKSSAASSTSTTTVVVSDLQLVAPPTPTTTTTITANSRNVNKNSTPKGRGSSANVLRKGRKNSTASSSENSVVSSYDPQQKIVLKRSEFIDPNLSFTIFTDLSRGLGAIGPSEVILAVESLREPGTQDELLSDSGVDLKSKKPVHCQFKVLSLFLSVPHFLPLKSVYSAGEPFSRILRYNALEQYTKGELGNSQVSSFRFYGPRYEKQVPALSPAQEKDPRIVEVRKRIPNPNAYLESTLIIKHPILGFYSKKLVTLQFVVLKKIRLSDDNNTIVGHLKAKVVQLKRSADLRNIEIYVDENRVPEAASDVNAMNQQNITPVIQTGSGLVPLLARTTYQQPEYHQVQQQQPQQVETQFQYVQYHYQTPTELVQEISSASGGNNLVLNFDNNCEYFAPTFRDENGAQVVILTQGTTEAPSSSYIHSQQSGQEIVHQAEPSNFYTGQEQSVIIQPHQPFSSPQPQAYSGPIQVNQIQSPGQAQQHQLIIQPPDSNLKEVHKQLIYLPGTNFPIQVEFQPSPQATEQPRSYSQQQQTQEPLIQLQPQYSRGGGQQQIVIQQQQQQLPNQNQYQIQQQQQQLVNSQNQLRHSPQHQQQNLQYSTQQTGNSTAVQQHQYQYRNVTQTQQQTTVIQHQQVIQQQHTQQQQHQVLHQQGPINHQIQPGSPAKYQTVQQRQTPQSQPLLATSVPGRQVQAPTPLQSPPNSVPGASVYQNQQHRSPFTSQQQTQFTQNRAPLSSSGQQQPPPPQQQQQQVPAGKQKKVKQPKGSPKKNGKGVPVTSVLNPDSLFTPEQLEQLRLREQKATPTTTTVSGGPYPTSQVSQPAPVISHSSAYRPGLAPPSYSATPPGVTHQYQPQPQTPQPRPTTGKGSRARASPASTSVPVISSTTSLARFVSPGTVSAGHSVAPKSQIPSPSKTHPHTTTGPALGTPIKKTKTFVVVASTPPPAPGGSTPPGALPLSAVPKHEFRSKPGHLAVCPHCGVGNLNILRCNRCKHELPADVKFIKDDFTVNKGGAAVAIPAQNTSVTTSSTTTITTTASSDKKVSTASTTSKAKSGGTGRKIVLVNKPQPPTPSTSSVVVNKAVVAPGTVQVQIQPDGGSAVTINSGSVVQTRTVITKAPVKRKPARKRQAHELITLSSDDEEPASTPKVAKQEDKPVETTASSLVAAAKNPASTVAPTTATTATASTATTTSSTTTTDSSSKTNSTSAEVKQEGVEVKQEVVIKKEEQPGTSATTNNSQKEEVNMPKEFKINLSLDEKVSTPKLETDNDPGNVYTQIEERMGAIGNTFQYCTLTARSVRVGSYKVTSTDTHLPIAVQVTELGFKFSLPAANYKLKNIKLCIPIDSIVGMRAHFAKRLQVIFITTGPKYATWIRNMLGLDGNSQNETSNYYCPLNGLPSQQTITILLETVSDADVGIIRKLYSSVLTELDYGPANDLLMQVTPHSYKSSIGFNNSVENTSSSVPKIVSATSVIKEPIPSPPGSNVSGFSTASTVIVQRSSETPNNQIQASTSTGTTEANNIDQDKAILFYEGKNNVKVPICPNDIKCLGYAQFLNDQIIDFWMAVIQSERLSEEDRKRTFVYDSFFYSKLTEKMKRKVEEDGNLTAGERRHGRVKKRTKNVDIFSKDFLIVPINENFHWFIAIICFPGMEGFHDYATLEALPNYKRPRLTGSKSGSNSTTTNNNKKPVVYNQPKNDTTAAYSTRDEAPEDPDEMDQVSSPDTPSPEGGESKSQGKTETGESSSSDRGPSTSAAAASSSSSSGTKRKSEFGQAVKHPCILIFDSLAGEARGRIYSTLREYLRIEYKTKKKADRVFDKTTMPGVMPKVPQQPNFSDCGLYMLQYVESFFNNPIPSYDPKVINLKNWFPPEIAENKREEIYDFIREKVRERTPQNECRIPAVNFIPDEEDLRREEEAQMLAAQPYADTCSADSDESYYEESDDEDLYAPVNKSPKKLNSKKQQLQHQQSKGGSDSDDHNYATTPPAPTAVSKASAATAAMASNLPTVMVAITPLPATSDTPKKNT